MKRLPLTGDITRVVDGLAFVSESEREALRVALAQRATTVAAELGRPIRINDAIAALTDAFAEHLDLTFEPNELSAREQQRIARLLDERYRHPAWTGKN